MKDTHFLQAMKDYTYSSVQFSSVAQSCPTLCEPMDCDPSGSSVHGILQARILEWVAMSSARRSSWARDRTQSSVSPALAGGFFTTVPPGKPNKLCIRSKYFIIPMSGVTCWSQFNEVLGRIIKILANTMEKAMAPHSSTLAWKLPWTEEPGGLQSMGSQRVGHDWGTSLSLSAFMHWRRKWQPTPVFLPGESQGQGSLVGCRPLGCTESDTTKVT